MNSLLRLLAPGFDDRTALRAVYFVALYWSVLFLVVFYFPPADYDVNSSYLYRIKADELGSMRANSTLDLQYLFPTFFDFLHAPFLKLGYFIGAPSFILATAFLVLVLRESKNAAEFNLTVLIVFATQPFLVLATAAKNDLALGVFAFLAWYAIFRVKKDAKYFPLALIPIFCLVGTKWLGIPLAVLFFFVLLFESVKEKTWSRFTPLYLALLLPLYWWTGSLTSYLDNYLEFGTPTPVPDFLKGAANVAFLPNLVRFICFSLLDSFDLFTWLLEFVVGHPLLPYLNDITLGAKSHRLTVLPSAELCSFGIILPLLLSFALLRLARAGRSYPYLVAAAAAVLHLAVILYQIRLDTGDSRYLFPVFTLLVLPAVSQLAGMARARQLLIPPLIGLLIIQVFIGTFWHHDRRLLEINFKIAPDKVHNIDSVWSKALDRDHLWFAVWGGEFPVFEYMRKNVTKADSLLVLTYHGAESTFLYPFVKDRHGSNTRVWWNQKLGPPPEPYLRKFDFVLLCKIELESGEPAMLLEKAGFRLVNKSFQKALYQRVARS